MHATNISRARGGVIPELVEIHRVAALSDNRDVRMHQVRAPLIHGLQLGVEVSAPQKFSATDVLTEANPRRQGDYRWGGRSS